MSMLDLKPGAPVKKLTLQNGEVFFGETADQLRRGAIQISTGIAGRIRTHAVNKKRED